MKKKKNEYSLEYWARGSASPAQPEVEKEKAARGPSCKLQAPSSKRLKKDTMN